MKKISDIKKRFELYEKQFEGKFESKPTDVLWLDKEEWSKRIRFSMNIVKCIICGKEVKVMYRYSMLKLLPERLNGKLCPNCGYGGLKI